jgi:hypothetical protein
MWARIAAAGPPAAELAIGSAFVGRALPETAIRLIRITAGADELMAIPDGAF